MRQQFLIEMTTPPVQQNNTVPEKIQKCINDYIWISMIYEYLVGGTFPEKANESKDSAWF